MRPSLTGDDDYRLLSMDEFAAFIRSGKTTAYKEIREKKIPVKKRGDRTFVLLKDARAYTANLEGAE